MGSTWELKEKSTGELKTTVEGDSWQKAQKKAFNKLSKKVNLPGFRPGQAPAALVKKHISTQNILMEAVDEVAGNALQDAVKEHDLWVVSRPALDIDSIDEDKVTFKFIVTVKPEVTLGAYKGLEVKKEDATVTDEDVEAELTRLQERFADLVVKEEGAVEQGDTAVIDFEGFKDGVAFEGGKGEAYSLEIGSGAFIPGFEEKLIGMKTEETKDIDLTFPEDYQVADLAGAPVVFKVMVHEIKMKELPEANDELIKQAEIKDVETLEAYRDYTEKNLKESKKRQVENQFESELLTAITDNAKVEIPDVMIDEETDRLVKDFEQRLQSQGFNLDQFKQMTGQSDEMIRQEMSKDAYSKVKVRLVLEAIAAEEKIELSDEDVNAEYERIANMYNMQTEQVKGMVAADSIAYDLRIRRALELVKESAGK